MSCFSNVALSPFSIGTRQVTVEDRERSGRLDTICWPMLHEGAEAKRPTPDPFPFALRIELKERTQARVSEWGRAGADWK